MNTVLRGEFVRTLLPHEPAVTRWDPAAVFMQKIKKINGDTRNISPSDFYYANKARFLTYRRRKRIPRLRNT